MSLVTALAALASAQQPQLGMTVRGVVRSTEGAPCANCQVVAYNFTVGRVITARTTSTGEFRLEELPAGEYTISVVDALGNMGILAWRHDGEGTSAVSSDLRLRVEQGVNVEGLLLASPPFAAPVTDAELLAALAEPRQAAGLRRGMSPSAASTIACPAPRPSPVVYPPPPDPSNRIVFGAKRGDDKILKPAENPCGRAAALGCTETDLEKVPRNVPKDGLPVCRADGLLILPTDVIVTKIQLRPPESNRYSPDPPDAPGCAEILKPDCGGPPGYHNFSGTELHECTHRTLDEKAAAKIFDEYVDSIKRIQAEIDAKGRCYRCCKEREEDAVKAYQAFRKRVFDAIDKIGESPAYVAECAYYKSRYEGFCR